MSEAIGPAPQTIDWIKSDLASGSHTAYDGIIDSFVTRGGGKKEDFPLKNSGKVQVEVSLGPTEIYRVHFHQHGFRGRPSRYISVWKVNQDGYRVSNSCSMMWYESRRIKVAHIDGTSQSDMEGGDLQIEPKDLAEHLDTALGGLSRENWKILISDPA